MSCSNIHEIVLELGPLTASARCGDLERRKGQRTTPVATAAASDNKQDEDIYEVEEDIVEFENVTVKFRISDTQVIAQVYPNRLKIGEVKKDLARKFEINVDWLCVKQSGEAVTDDCMILETCCDEYGIYNYTLELDTSAISSWVDSATSMPKLDLEVYYSKHRLPDFITVHIPAEDTDDGNPRNIVVEIENKAITKPFLCGYRDKITGIEYLDAFTQTGPIFDQMKYKRYVSRDVQTYEYKTKILNTMHDQTSECFLDGNNVRYVSAAGEFTIVPRKYQTYAQKMRLENKLAKIILIQRNWRRFLLQRYMKRCAREYRQLVANRLAAEREFKEEIEKRMSRAERTRLLPRTKDDFELIYHEIEKWKKNELKRIASRHEGASRIAEVNLLLDREIDLLNKVERQRQLVKKSMEDFRQEQLLTKLGKPIKWIGYKDTVIHLDLLRNQRARFLHELHKDLRRPLPKEERLELLQKVKEIVINEREFPQFAELFDLFEREKNLLLYTKYCDVDVLRKRQNLLFVELIKFSKDYQPPKVGRRLCEVCKKVKSLDKFAIRTRQNTVDVCNSCYSLKTSAKDNSAYTAILRSIQREERKKHCNASFAFIMQVDDIRHLVEQIWHGHSVLSKDDDLNSLRLTRWIKSDDWSPWNCICLTEQEARDHAKLHDPEEVYDTKLLLQIRNAHLSARAAFHKLAAVATEFVETGEWFKVALNQQRSVPPLMKFNKGKDDNKGEAASEEECPK